MRILYLLIAFLYSASCVADEAKFETYKSAITKTLAAELKDFESARIKGWTLPVPDEKPGGEWMCVSVNSRNSYGAYTGFRLHAFLFRKGKIADVQWSISDYWDQLSRELCKLEN